MNTYEGGYNSHSSSSSPLLSGDSSPFSFGTSVFDDEDGNYGGGMGMDGEEMVPLDLDAEEDNEEELKRLWTRNWSKTRFRDGPVASTSSGSGFSSGQVSAPLSRAGTGSSDVFATPSKQVRFANNTSPNPNATTPTFCDPFAGNARLGGADGRGRTHPPRYSKDDEGSPNKANGMGKMKIRPVKIKIRPRPVKMRPLPKPTEIPMDASTDAMDVDMCGPGPGGLQAAAVIHPVSVSVSEKSVSVEQGLWDKKISFAVDNAEGLIDLSGRTLSFIPPAIKDLANLVTLPTRPSASSDSFDTVSPEGKNKNGRLFKRYTTAPAVLGEKPLRDRQSSAGAFGISKFNRGKSMKVAFGPGMLKTYEEGEGQEQGQEEDRNVMKNEIQLFLQNNLISVLPPELCPLKNLVVLSLRSNKLEEIPHYISHLTGLRELNVSNNNLTQLPAEILGLNLTALTVHPNPFYTYSPLDQSQSQSQGRWLGEEVIHNGGVPSLREMALRVLINPGGPESESWKKGISELEEWYEFPLIVYEGGGISNEVLALLAFGSSGSVSLSSAGTGTAKEITTQPRNPLHSLCPSPKHSHSEGVIYIEPTLSRLEWVDRIGAVNIPAPRVPVLWRGCSVGCLNFLDDHTPKQDEDVDMDDPESEVAGLGPNNESFDLSSDEE